MTAIGVVTPFWLDRPAAEAVDIAVEADRNGFGELWVGEMATFDAFALATAVGLRTERIGVKVGPLPLGVRTPVALGLGVASVAALARRPVGLALGGSSPAIVNGWHDRPWDHAALRMRETVAAVRTVLEGQRLSVHGKHVRSNGFRLREPAPVPITVAAFGPAMTRVAAEIADEVVLNLVPPSHVSRVRKEIDGQAHAAGRTPPRLAVWVPVALNPGEATLRQLAAQASVYLSPPGYGEMFAELGYGELVAAARSGAKRASLVVPPSLVADVGAIGSAAQVRDRIAAYHAAGADHVGLVPATAEDPAGRTLLRELAP
ncbi:MULTISPECIES: LLM class F420-dependent oxidoreductase [unclassified Amycolatopsis]|uniref:LLM class F420-dependent oxidoreductase n=1 Tax=unclassified Amycolatopsis TaxID=2618356 RepID=UPI001C6967C5|nr:LLM class F420-dependent oxidoreductase [Amycolatopsis sp. DSM 110486]QYN17916.1 LLM class F420-dependent oxidoreductase [Amycolatopsis sp. DSM 110486]